MWRWEQQEPFGVNPADENPSGLGAFDLPLRLPGQYFDRETNLHYNNNRDFDPGSGRYVEGDPLGLVPDSARLLLTLGGKLHSIPLNHLYAYVAGDPLGSTDPLGLARVKVYEVLRGVQMFFGGSMFSCDTRVGSCGKFHERFRLTWTAEASDSCVLAGFETKVVNGPTQFFGTHMQWWQATHTWWKYKSSNNCPCELTDYRFEEKETPFPHPGPESLN